MRCKEDSGGGEVRTACKRLVWKKLLDHKAHALAGFLIYCCIWLFLYYLIITNFTMTLIQQIWKGNILWDLNFTILTKKLFFKAIKVLETSTVYTGARVLNFH